MSFVEQNADQARETVNTAQRYEAWRAAVQQARAYRGSLVWSEVGGRTYLVKSAYDASGARRQTSLGARDSRTEAIKLQFDRARNEARDRLSRMKEVLDRQTAINKAVGLGRAPALGARVLRALDDAGLLGTDVRVLGTWALFAYEAAAGVQIDSGLTATEDLDLLFNSRRSLAFAAKPGVRPVSLMKTLEKVDRSFRRMPNLYRAVNAEGFMVDFIKPDRVPPWKKDASSISEDPEDLTAAGVANLAWHESAPAFEALAIDQRGAPLRIVASDPRVFAIHKFWLSSQPDREPVKRRRDLRQAQTVVDLVCAFFKHLPFQASELRMLPAALVVEAQMKLGVKPVSEPSDDDGPESNDRNLPGVG